MKTTKRTRWLLLSLFLGIVPVTLAQADSWENVKAAYDRGDYAAMMRSLRPLAEQGDARAQGALGSMYFHGEGVPQDYAEAAKWFHLAAEQGVAKAQSDLGVMYSEGYGLPQDDAEAVRWYRLAADQGDPFAQYTLGLSYMAGVVVPQDFVQAHKWFNIAASRFPASEAEQRAKAVKLRDLFASKMTPAQVAEAQKLAREWQPKWK